MLQWSDIAGIAFFAKGIGADTLLKMRVSRVQFIPPAPPDLQNLTHTTRLSSMGAGCLERPAAPIGPLKSLITQAPLACTEYYAKRYS
jgi:hypothetical protein